MPQLKSCSADQRVGRLLDETLALPSGNHHVGDHSNALHIPLRSGKSQVADSEEEISRRGQLVEPYRLVQWEGYSFRANAFGILHNEGSAMNFVLTSNSLAFHVR